PYCSPPPWNQDRGVAPPLGTLLFCTPQKSKQKKVPDLLALRVPSVPLPFAAQKKTRYAQTFFFETLQRSTTLRLRHTGGLESPPCDAAGMK
ncbi:MAG: hypothetical protein J7K90_03350, partial [Desulfuromusa sp.]|nr:hypothetical protein [Desulfuromusa sp.]